MPNIQDLSLEIQEMIVKHLNTPGFCNSKWREYKLYKNDDVVKDIFPYFATINGNVALRYHEQCNTIPWMRPNWLKYEFKKEPWVITTAALQISMYKDDY